MIRKIIGYTLISPFLIAAIVAFGYVFYLFPEAGLAFLIFFMFFLGCVLLNDNTITRNIWGKKEDGERKDD